MATLAVDSLGNIALPLRSVSGVDAVRVRVLVRLQTQLGTWLTDTSKGLPVEEWTGSPGFGKGPSAEEASAVVRAQLESIVGVQEVESVDATRSASALTVTASLIAEEDGQRGTVTVSTSYDPWDTSPAPAWYVVDSGPGF